MYHQQTINAGQSATYTVTVNRGSGSGSSGSFSATLTIVWDPTLPSGITATSAPNSVSFGSQDNSKQSTLTIQTSSSTPAGTYTFQVKATRTDNSNDYAVSENVTLKVNPLDNTPPVIIPAVSGTLGNNGWYTSNVTVSWSVNDPESGIISMNGCDTTTINYDTTGTTLTCSATNGAGLSSSESVTIKRDATTQTVNATPDRSPDNNG